MSATDWLKRLLSSQAPRFDFTLEDENETIASARYGQRRLLLLPFSADYWVFPPKAAARRSPEEYLLVSWRHNSVVPLPVLALDEGYLYAPYEFPHGFDLQAKLTKKSSKIFLGALLAGIQGAYDRLSSLPRSTRQRYERKLRSVSVRPGRPRAA